ncbi:uncharacterized protein LODBEIA_P59730 [Lodderomyces beijingensis]|uniref:BZIP domain-containing protein n=1 Tax=Lodderomyces beijingensis TaxID=1775926 RepID=A0ABP0ZUZ7_9ASCO
MKFEPTDYLQNLNLDFEATCNNDYSDDYVSPVIDQQQLQQDLDLFSRAANDFFSLDVFGDSIVPIKPEQNAQYHQQQQPFSSLQPPHQSPVEQYPQHASFVKPQAQTSPHVQPGQPTSFLSIPSSYSTASTPLAGDYLAAATQASILDKKKRNTAASARFRIKKKLKEQELQSKSKELEEKVERLQQRLKKLEVENRCLKTIIFKQNEEKNSELVDSIKKRITTEYELTAL